MLEYIRRGKFMNEEKIIIKGERYNIKKISLIWLAVTAAILLPLSLIIYQSMYDTAYYFHDEDSFCVICGNYYSTSEACAAADARYYLWFTLFIPTISSLLILGLFFLLTYFMEIIVTDKRVYGKTYFGRSVDLPLDSISSVGSSWLKGIAVATSSGKISFILLKNAKQIHKEITTLLINRQNKKKQEKPVLVSNSNADELKKYKELLDSGIITQEEFDAKKKQLLGL